mgnify:CR=1 FL=1
MINTRQHTVVHIARMTLEARTALSIGTGSPDGVFDTTLATDANGLPALPGTSLAGVLRHLYQQVYCDNQESQELRNLFGYQHRNEGRPSALWVSWGCIQDSQGQPVEGLLLGEERQRLEKDPLLAYAAGLVDAPEFRDRVRINHRGAAADKGKFDRSVLPAGFRFSVELQLFSTERHDEHWEKLLKLLLHPAFRLGGNTRAGLGRFKLVSLHEGSFDLSAADEAKRWCALSRSVGCVQGLNPREFENKPFPGAITGTLVLEPEAFWRIGGGDLSLRGGSSKEKPADLLPKLEPRVVWNDDGGRVVSQLLLVPASSIKGALSHRLAFHHNVLNDTFADDVADVDAYDTANNDAVKQLFGWVKSDEEDGAAGRLLLEDAYVDANPKSIKTIWHNAIDRYTGGVRNHMLFSEDAVWTGVIRVDFAILTAGIDDKTREALQRTLEDLCEGRLAIGAGSTKGHGYCRGSIEWCDGGQWLQGGTRT